LLTPKGEKILRELTLHHREELQLQGPALVAALKRAMQLGKDARDGELRTHSKKTEN
jgi:hypothetical protein